MRNCTKGNLNTESEQSIHTCKTSKTTTKFFMNGLLHINFGALLHMSAYAV